MRPWPSWKSKAMLIARGKRLEVVAELVRSFARRRTKPNPSPFSEIERLVRSFVMSMHEQATEVEPRGRTCGVVNQGSVINGTLAGGAL